MVAKSDNSKVISLTEIRSKKKKEWDVIIDHYHSRTPEKITQLRENFLKNSFNHKLSKADLGIILGAGPQNVGRVEKPFDEPNSINATVKYLIKIAVLYGVSIDWLVGLSDKEAQLSTKQGESQHHVEYLENLLKEKERVIRNNEKLIQMYEAQTSST